MTDYELSVSIGSLIGFSGTSFLLTWLVLLFAKPKTQTRFTVWTTFTFLVIVAGNVANSEEPAYQFRLGAIAFVIVFTILWLIYRKDFGEKEEQITQLSLSPNSFATDQSADCPEFVFGKYINQYDTSEYIELKLDRTFNLQKRNMALTGRFNFIGKTLTLILANGQSAKSQIVENVLTDEDNKTWIHTRTFGI